MMARSANAPLKGRIQKRKTNNLQIITSGLQRTAGPYRCANSGLMHGTKIASLDHFVGTQHKALRYYALERRPASKDCGRWGGSLGIGGNVTSAVD